MHELRAGQGAPRSCVQQSEVDRIRELAKASPEFRIDVVAQARADLAAGTLTADPQELARRIAQDLLG